MLAAAIVLLVRWRRARQRAAAEALSRAQAEARADHLALHDPVTQLANRHGLRQALEALIAQGRPFAAIRLELLELEPVEAIAGHAFVEQLLHALAQRLREHHSGPVARISDQGFVVVCLDRTDAEGAETAMRALVRLTGRRLEVAGVPFELSACAGAALHPDHGGDVEEVLRAAAIACTAARMHPGSVALYAASLVPDPRNLTLLADLRGAQPGRQRDRRGRGGQPHARMAGQGRLRRGAGLLHRPSDAAPPVQRIPAAAPAARRPCHPRPRPQAQDGAARRH